LNCYIRHILTLFLLCSLTSAFGQKFAVYVSGAGEAGINKSFGNKLLAAISQSGKYAEVVNSEAFFDELAKSYNGDIGQITQTANKYGADIVCVVSMTEAFGAYSISAKLVNVSDTQVIKTTLLDRSLKSLEDLTAASNYLVRQLLRLQPQEPPPPPPAAVASSDKKEDSSGEYNDDRLSFGIRAGFNSSFPGFQLGLVSDIAVSDGFHYQPGVMYIQKDAEDKDGDAMTLHYIEIPVLLSLKFSAFRINAGPYFAVCIYGASGNIESGVVDMGLNAGFGFDIGMFYIGMFYEYGVTSLSRIQEFHNSTLGFNFGINL